MLYSAIDINDHVPYVAMVIMPIGWLCCRGDNKEGRKQGSYDPMNNINMRGLCSSMWKKGVSIYSTRVKEDDILYYSVMCRCL